MTDGPLSLRVIGPGRAGESLRRALAGAGWSAQPSLYRDDDLSDAATGVELLVVAVPDAAVAPVAASVGPGDAVVIHLAGSLGCDVLAPHTDTGGLHPLVALPSPDVGETRLVSGAWFGVAATTERARQMVERVVDDLGGRAVAVADRDRAAYHAAAAIAANHLVALMAQVEAVAGAAGVPLQAFTALAAGALSDVAALGPGAALTGPVARGDWATVRAHRGALAPEELEAYDAMSRRAARLAGTDWPVSGAP
ncbi:DUF2520 domain-containing protein [Acidiferrimicrobium sp. IK]|uniref:DUF2520 domain-containing protein n=1 Tax=Acidiferrimicrobium sp. IK TaxID=2871700 RepID=UPI0021CB930A|nr:DUF2520 domain-containing protein [Acidiferrimicrobium sp. IK]MCU4186098.1 DUF2520 domain-containing protein [Acidiferrimicrobium sp. IK]